MENPTLSVCLITFNQVDYIRQTIESIIGQRITYTWNLIIADDCSSDGTKEILREFKSHNPDLIKLILQEKNVGPAKNWRDLLNSASGKYIAYCEGDDYWIDTNKIQTQIKFLEEHKEFVGCFHNSEERYEDENKSSFLYCNYPSAQRITFRDLSFANVIPSCSMVYRNKLFAEYPEWIFRLKMGDWPLHLLNAQFGDYWYIPKIMAVHRLHSNSTWMLQNADRNRQFVIEAYDIMIKEFDHDKRYSELLAEGKQSFIKGENHIPHRASHKSRVKGWLIRILEKF